MKIKFLYNKNLKMSPNKLAAQVGHVAANLAVQNIWVEMKYDNYPKEVTHVVLGVSKTKFDEKLEELVNSKDDIWYITVDEGRTEVEPGTRTVLGFVEGQ